VNIVTIQHTESHHHLNKMVGSRTDWDLTPKGLKDIKRIAKRLRKEELDKKDIIVYTSPLKRAKNGAYIVAQILNAKLVIDDRINQLDLGEATGKSLEWFIINRKTDDITLHSRAFANAESNSEVWDRLTSFYNDVLMKQSRERIIIIISHGITLSFLNMIHLGLEKKSVDSCLIKGDSGGVTFYGEFPDGKKYTHRVSDMSYVKRK